MFRAVTRLFNRASVLRGSLLNVSEVGDDVELTPSDAVLSSVCEGDSFANVNVEKMRCTSSFIGARVELISSSVLERGALGRRPSDLH